MACVPRLVHKDWLVHEVVSLIGNESLSVKKHDRLKEKHLFGQVSVYHVQGSHLRTLTFPNMTGEFISCCFTKDTKFLVALGSAPEHTVVYWKWSNMKLIAHTKTSVLASRIRVNPADASIITTSGKDHLKLWRLEKDLSLKANALLPGKTETKTHFVDHACKHDIHWVFLSWCMSTLM